MTNEQELNKKLAKFAHRSQMCDNFTKSLDACFKWLVPLAIKKLQQRGSVVPLIDLFSMWYDQIVLLNANSSNTDRAALALCLAIEKLIDSEAKK